MRLFGRELTVTKMKAFVLASGPSMNQQTADAVRGKELVIAVSDAFRLAPWADALVSSDAAWWVENQEAHDFPSRKFSAAPVFGVERVPDASLDSNSGLLAIKVAVSLGAATVILLGYDMGGTHFFGKHLEPLENTTEHRFRSFCRQFAQYHPEGVEIVNATPGSALRAYPLVTIETVIH